MSMDEIIWLVLIVPGWLLSIRLVVHDWNLVRAIGEDGAALIYAKGARAQEIVRLVALTGLLAAVPVGRYFPGRGAVLALFLGAACLTINAWLAGRLTARLEAEEEEP